MSRIYRDISVAGRHFTQNWDVNGLDPRARPDGL